MKSTNSFFIFLFWPLSSPSSFLFLFSFFTKKRFPKRGTSVKRNDSFTKPPRGMRFWLASVSQKKGFLHNGSFEQWKFHETPKGKMFWAMTVSRKPRRGKMFYLARTRTTTTPHTRYNEQWKINICRVGAYCSSRFYSPIIVFEYFIFCGFCERG